MSAITTNELGYTGPDHGVFLPESAACQDGSSPMKWWGQALQTQNVAVACKAADLD